MPAVARHDATGYVKGRNYWDNDKNALGTTAGYGYKEGATDTRFNQNDPRIVTIFIAPTPEAFAGNGQNTYPIAGFVEVYVTGFGPINGMSTRRSVRGPTSAETSIFRRQHRRLRCGVTSST